jgi:hypothetical protein
MPVLRADFIGFLGVESASPGTRTAVPVMTGEAAFAAKSFTRVFSRLMKLAPAARIPTTMAHF